MHFLELRIENVMRISIVEVISKDSHFVEVAGANAQGKSSVLNSIWMLLGGKKAEPLEPIRKGCEKAMIRGKIGDGKEVKYIITKKFTAKSGTSSITIENADGARFPSPQGVLDSIVGDLMFDPVAFMRMEPLKQVEALRKVVTIEVDLDALDAMNKRDYELRAEINLEIKTLKGQQAQFANLPDDLPAEKLDTAALTLEIADAAKHNADAENAVRTHALGVAQLKTDIATLERQTIEKIDRANRLRQEAAQLDKEADSLLADANRTKAHLESLKDAPIVSLVDVTAIKDKLQKAHTVNSQIDRRTIRDQVASTITTRESESKALTEKMEKREQMKVNAIASAKFPVEGLAFGDGHLTFNGVPLSQASGAQKINIACSIAMAANPKLKVLRVQDGSILDDDSNAMLRKLAEEHGYQVWLEVIRGGPEAIVLEDGHVAE